MEKVENPCKECRGLGWCRHYNSVYRCDKCKLFKSDPEAYQFVFNTCEQWQRTVALIFATRLLADAVPVPPMQTANLEDGVIVTPVSAEETAELGTVRVGVDEKLNADDGTTDCTPIIESGGAPTPPGYVGNDTCRECGVPDGDAHLVGCTKFAESAEGQRRWPLGPIERIEELRDSVKEVEQRATSAKKVCIHCGAIYGCCEHEGAEMVDPNTRPFTKEISDPEIGGGRPPGYVKQR